MNSKTPAEQMPRVRTRNFCNYYERRFAMNEWNRSFVGASARAQRTYHTQNYIWAVWPLARETNLNYEPSKPNSYYYTGCVVIEIERIYLEKWLAKHSLLCDDEKKYYKSRNGRALSLSITYARVSPATIAPHTLVQEAKSCVFV